MGVFVREAFFFWGNPNKQEGRVENPAEWLRRVCALDFIGCARQVQTQRQEQVVAGQIKQQAWVQL